MSGSSTNFYQDNEDLQFYFEKGIDWETLVKVSEDYFKLPDGPKDVSEAKEIYRDIVDMVGKFSANIIDPLAIQIDHKGLTFKKGEVQFPTEHKEIFDGIQAMELHGMCLPRELGGMNIPLMIYMVNAELMARGDVSVMAHHSFFGGMALAMFIYSIYEGSTEFDHEKRMITKTRFNECIQEIIRGEAWGSMDITEPNAGSDMAKLSCKGEQLEDGSWVITGEKIFITSGNGKYHFVVAKTESDSEKGDLGLNGLSLFLVPAYENDANGNKKWLAKINGIEKKIGHHGSATVSISFDRTPGHLLGKRGEGFRLMLMIMNNARVAVGFESLGLCESAYRKAMDYASVRESMGRFIKDHEMIKDYLEEMKTDIQAIRAMAMEACYHEELAQKYNLKALLKFINTQEGETLELVRKKQKKHKEISRRLTPLLKYYAAEKAVDMARKCIQIHGGVGYTKEFGAEKLLRDSLVFPIYEGTSQIQSLMATKDHLMNVINNPKAFIKELASFKWDSQFTSDSLAREVAMINYRALKCIFHLIKEVGLDKWHDVKKTKAKKWKQEWGRWDVKKDFGAALGHAERLTKLLADREMANLLERQAGKFPERRDILDRFLKSALPRSEYNYNLITSKRNSFRSHSKVASKSL